MTSVKISKEQVSYDSATDTLYIRCGAYDDCYTEVVDISPNISVFFGHPDGGFAGAEIYDFKQSLGSLPNRLRLATDNPIELEMPSCRF
jgi:hypothetical protein